jgi:hypothetical protein
MFLVSLIQGNIAGREINFYPIIAFMLLFYAFTTVKAIYRYGIISLYTIYLYTAFFFIYSRFYFHVSGYKSFLTIGFPSQHYFSDNVGIIFISVTFVSHYIIDCVICHCTLPGKRNNKIQNYPDFEHWGFALMLSSFPVIIYKLSLRLLYVREYGYTAIYSGHYPEISLPIWTRGSGTIFFVGYLMVISSCPSKRKYIFSSAIFLIYSFVGSLRGSRGDFITYIITIIYMYQRFYRKKISLKSIMAILLFIITFSVILGVLREKKEIGSILYLDDLLKYFFYDQGNSIGSPLTVIETSGKFKNHPFPFIFSPLVYPFFSALHQNSGQTNILLEKYNDLGSITTYYLSPTAYFNGYGIGRTFIAEMYDCGGFFGIVFWSIMLALLILKAEKDFLRSKWCIIFYFGIIKTIIYLPRNVFFAFFDIIPNLLCIILLNIFLHTFKPAKKSNEDER